MGEAWNQHPCTIPICLTRGFAGKQKEFWERKCEIHGIQLPQKSTPVLSCRNTIFLDVGPHPLAPKVPRSLGEVLLVSDSSALPRESQFEKWVTLALMGSLPTQETRDCCSAVTSYLYP